MLLATVYALIVMSPPLVETVKLSPRSDAAIPLTTITGVSVVSP